MIHQVVFGFSFFSECLKMYPEYSIPLSEFVACPTRHPTCLIFASLEIMPRVSTALHLPVTYNDTLESWQIIMITTNFLYVHIVYCRSLQLRIR